MSYSIRYSEEAKQDVRAIYEYIAFELCAPEVAAAQYRRIIGAVRKLDEMPLRFPLYKDEPWSELGMGRDAKGVVEAGRLKKLSNSEIFTRIVSIF